MRRQRSHDAARPDVRFDSVADTSAALVIRSYSSSFWLASRLLGSRPRREVGNIYALVRIADEIVDAPRPGQGVEDRRRALGRLAEETDTALVTGSSPNLVVHAFARTAQRIGIDAALIDPFFASMRTDLERGVHDETSLSAYIHGSAEVVGLMCLRAFLADDGDPDARYRELAPAAMRLGAAFQKVNFLRDIGSDADYLGRTYLPDISDSAFALRLDDVDADLAVAATAITALPRSSRVAVCVAHDLFADLSRRLRLTPASEVARNRVRVPDGVKLRIAAAAVARNGRPR